VPAGACPASNKRTSLAGQGLGRAGWSGPGSAKNGNVIHRRSGLLVPESPPAPTWKFTGRCSANSALRKLQRCIDACPPGRHCETRSWVDARRCIAFHTIENRDARLPAEISAAMGPWVAVADICQDVLPLEHQPLIS